MEIKFVEKERQMESTYEEAARSCARQLAAMFGSEEEAAKALQEDPVAMVAIALDEHMRVMRKMAVKAHMNQIAFAGQVLNAIK